MVSCASSIGLAAEAITSVGLSNFFRIGRRSTVNMSCICMEMPMSTGVRRNSASSRAKVVVEAGALMMACMKPSA